MPGLSGTGSINASGAALIAVNSNSNSYTGYRVYNDQVSALRAVEIDYAGSTFPSSLENGGVIGEAAAVTATGPYPLMLGTNNTMRMTITASGNVGIGNGTAAQAQLVIGNGTADTGLYIVAHTVADIYVKNDANGARFGTPNNSSVLFDTNAAERMRITATGLVGIGTTSPTALLTVNGAALATAWNTTSDIRTKTDVRPFDANALVVVGSLKPVTFLWKDASADRSGRRQIGFIAQDVMPVLPDVVRKADDAAGTLSLNYAALVPVLTKAIQEQQAEIAGLKTRLASAAADVVALRERAALVEASANRTTLRLEAEIHQIAAAQRIRLASSESIK